MAVTHQPAGRAHPAHRRQLEDEPGPPAGDRVRAEAGLEPQGRAPRLRRRRGRGLPAVHRPAFRADARLGGQASSSRSARRTSRSTSPAPTPARSPQRSWPRSTAPTSSSVTPSGAACTGRPTRMSPRRSPRRSTHNLVPVICVGETAEDREAHGPSAVPVAQLRAALAGVRRGQPTSSSPTSRSGRSAPGSRPRRSRPSRSRPRCAACSSRRSATEAADATRILYGGSVKAANIAGFMREPNVDGALVGGASLDIAEFSSIVQYQKHVGV